MDRLRRWQTKIHCLDNWDVYTMEVPPVQPCISTLETNATERNNWRQRHWLGRFRRRSIIVAWSNEMVNFSIALFGRCRVNGDIEDLISLLS